MDKDRMKRVSKRMEKKKDEAVLDKSFWMLSLWLKIHKRTKAQLWRACEKDLIEQEITTNQTDFELLLSNDKARSFSRRWALRTYLQKRLNYENVLVDIQRNIKFYDDIIRDIIRQQELVKKSL